MTSRRLAVDEDPTMPNSHLALVADDSSLGQTLQNRVRDRVPGPPPPLYPFAGVRDHLGPSNGGLVVCAAAAADDAAAAYRLVQEVRLRQWPATVVVVEAGACARDHALARLDPFVTGRLQWPDEAATLLDLIHFEGLARRDQDPAASP
jgi:hypothetical protein